MKKIITALCILLVLCGCTKQEETPIEEEKTIAEIYPEIVNPCVLQQATPDDVLAMLENGTGVIFFSWSECPWCHDYINHVNEAAITNNISPLYYDIYDDRDADNEFYQKVVALLADYVDEYAYETNGEVKKAYNKDGKVRIYVPMLVCVIKGEVVYMNYEGSMESDHDANSANYWQEDVGGMQRCEALDKDLDTYFKQVKTVIDELDEQGCSENCKLS